MYKENDKLVLIKNVGIEGKPGFIAKGSIVEFIRAIDTTDVTKSYVQVKHNDKVIVVPELSVSFVNPKRYDNALKEFNDNLMKRDPSLRVHHPNLILRLFYRFIGLFYKHKENKSDLSLVKEIINEK